MLPYQTKYHSQRAVIALTTFFLIATTAVIPLEPVFAQDSDVATSTGADQSAGATTQNDQIPSLDVASDTSVTALASTSSSSSDSLTVGLLTEDSSSTPSGDVLIENTSSTSSTQEEFQQERAPPVVDVSSTVPEPQPQKTTKFKKNSSLSEDAQLAAVRQHLIASGLPQEIIDRVDAYKVAEQQGPQQPGLLTKITDFFTGNTDAQKEQAKAETLAKQQPFKVDTYSGSIHTASEDSYNQTFSNSQEQSGGLMQKLKSFFNTGTLKNLNFNDTKSTIPFSWLLGQTAFAVSDNPSDYLAEGNEITFSQAIQDKANALGNDPLAILNFVRNNVTYIPYYGSKKGSDATLVEQAGNDTDKASLLIAMLRYGDVAARYRQVDAKMDIGTVTDLLGVNSANAAAQVLSLEQIPYTLYVDSNSNPLFFVIEHTYVEAYMPYGYSRGANVNDGGTSQWVPMDPSINAYYYEQSVDIVTKMNADGFGIEQFFDNYLNAGSSTLEPMDAFKNSVENDLTAYPPTYYPNLTYDEALMRSYPKDQNLSFIPGSLPYEVAANLDTYDYVPTSLRHTITFTVKNDQNTTVLSYAGYVSDLADRELLMTYDPATQADQDTLDTFDTIYDVVPLSLVAVKPKIKINGTVVATGSASTTLGQAQSYTMEFDTPTRAIGGSVTSNAVETINRNVITGNTDAIALDTDRVTPPELRPAQDTQTTSFVANQALYKTGVDFLYRLQNAQGELARITGGDFTNTATRATILNGIDVTYASSGAPYSLSWKGLRIDSSSKVKYFNRVNVDTATHFKEFTAVFGLQASQEESNIFQDNFNVNSIATVKGLKLVTAGTFSGVTLHKITSANENTIDALSISTSTKAIFHTAVQGGKIIYTPSAPVTYGTWQGLFYISIDFDGGTAAYTIGEGLNGGFSICALPGISAICNWAQDSVDRLINRAEASGGTLTASISVSSNAVFQGQPLLAVVTYIWNWFGNVITWNETSTITTTAFAPGIITLQSGYGTANTVNIDIQKQQLGTQLINFDADVISIASDTYHIPPDLMKSVIYIESRHPSDETPPKGSVISDPRSYRYEAHKDYDWYSRQSPSIPATTGWRGLGNYPEKHFSLEGTVLTGQHINEGNQVSAGYLEWSEHTSAGKLDITHAGTGNVSAAELVTNNPHQGWYSRASWNFTAQLLLAASYGLTQVMYETAVNRGFDTRTDNGQSDRPIEQLFDPSVNIDLAASHLADQYAGNWSDAVFLYNGGYDDPDPAKYDSVDYANDVMGAWDSGKGAFKLLILN